MQDHNYIRGCYSVGKKRMKRYPMEIRQAVIRRIKGGESQKSLSREYSISRWAIQCWLKERHLVGRLFCKLKNNRRFATGYEKETLFFQAVPAWLAFLFGYSDSFKTDSRPTHVFDKSLVSAALIRAALSITLRANAPMAHRSFPPPKQVCPNGTKICCLASCKKASISED